MMDDMVYLTIALSGMLFGLGIWTWTVLSRSKSLEARITSLENSIIDEE